MSEHRSSEHPVVLLLEDNFLLAQSCGRHLEQAGFTVLGPFPSMEAARAAMARGRPAAALLDVQVADGLVYPLAAELRARGIPFAFLSGFRDALRIPAALGDAPRLGKPVDEAQMECTLLHLLREGAPEDPAREPHARGAWG